MFRAKRLGILILLFVGLETAAEAQRLNFPRQLTAAELSTTGIALVNTSAAAVSATFNFYGTEGSLVTQSRQTVPARGQLARLVSEILPQARESGWIQVTSTTAELQGFEIVGNFATIVDGAGPAAEGRQLALIDFSREDIIHIANTTSQAGTVQVNLNTTGGVVLGTRSIRLAAFQPASLRLGDMNDDNNIDLVTLNSDVNISASITTKLPGGLDIGLTNATLTFGAPSTLFFPFAPTGPQGSSNWTTYVGISNLGTSAQNVSMTFTPDTGTAVTIQRNLSTGASIGDTVANLFGTPGNTFTAGWIQVTGTSGLAGVAAYQDSANGSLAIVPSQSTGASAFFFGHIASLAPWYTGIGLLNTSNSSASAEIYTLDNMGQLVGSPATFTLAPGRRTSLLSEFVPQVLQRASDGGWVFVRTTNNVPLLGFELFGHAISPILANVQGFALPSTSTFTPPAGSPTSAASVERTITTDLATVTKTQFSPRETIVYLATVTNSGSRDAAQLTFEVKDPRSQTMITSTIPFTLPVASMDLRFTSFIPSNALTGGYSATATLTSPKGTSTKSVTFNVSGGTTSPSVGQEATSVTSIADVAQLSFRPGDTARFVVPTSNFTSSSIMGVLNYQLTGPGLVNAGSGSVSYTIPTGISFKNIDIPIPPNSQQGLFAFTPNLTVGGATTFKGLAITVVPKSSSESIEIDRAFVADTTGVPRGGFTPGSPINMMVRRISSFGVTIPATIRYTITSPSSTAIYDQPISSSVISGGSTSTISINLSANAAAGTYTFRATLTYQNNDGETKTQTVSTTFAVGSGTVALTPSLTTQRLYVTDRNGIYRTSFSNGETWNLFRTNFSTYTSAVTGTALFQVSDGSTFLYSNTFATTFNPGLSIGAIGLTSNVTLQSTPLTFTLTATVPGSQPSINTTTFIFAGPNAPPLNFGISSSDDKMMPLHKWTIGDDLSDGLR